MPTAIEMYPKIKAETPNTILIFRMGDFCELFFGDAVTVSKALGLTLTSRDKNSATSVPMAGFPYHALEGYLAKLVKLGHRCAVCEQVVDPKNVKGLPKREATRIVPAE